MDPAGLFNDERVLATRLSAEVHHCQELRGHEGQGQPEGAVALPRPGGRVLRLQTRVYFCVQEERGVKIKKMRCLGQVIIKFNIL